MEGREEAVPEGVLVYFHNHSSDGAPLVLLPLDNVHNRWSFHDKGYLVRGEGAERFIAHLAPLPAQGLYVVREHIHLSGTDVLAERTLVQLGYNRSGEPILFVARAEGNGFSFSDRGFRFPDTAVLERLTPAGFDPPSPPERMLH